MPATASIRELRGSFPKIKKLLETEGEVIVSDYGKPKYLLTRYVAPVTNSPSFKDYFTRLTQYQPKPLTQARAKALNDENRGDR